jgi:hypothetical protein
MPWPPSTQGQGEGEGHSETWRNICSMPVRVHLGIAVLYCSFPRVLLLFGVVCVLTDTLVKHGFPYVHGRVTPLGSQHRTPAANKICCAVSHWWLFLRNKTQKWNGRDVVISAPYSRRTVYIHIRETTGTPCNTSFIYDLPFLAFHTVWCHRNEDFCTGSHASTETLKALKAQKALKPPKCLNFVKIAHSKVSKAFNFLKVSQSTTTPLSSAIHHSLRKMYQEDAPNPIGRSWKVCNI